ncbi:MAG: deoxyguanosinetriphosphate triphosphohydrolase [Desulfobacteraceae bacterium]|uniref:Deoxyguanosinetriphosphate triphosphohydrolase n=1 Tax=Candidatus Desulfaltia bathyphila TaxID=2841697 RepID=A0A8J6N541_9BACT|nr:deoxyguanosinetriphosphate triphosphohydrolase [Candidatus Desulfaltia bathyphila]MBL7196189.1 deoxyguanosinetriphosphate triphosphohydrolase [Desulfobacterales bacterium]
MSIREDFENREKSFIASYGCLSSESRGRLKTDEPCPIRTVFQQDRDRIIYSNAFRRLKHKTQVFLSPLGDHYRTRLTHTLEVAEIARTIARAMRLNEDLAEAIALGHDLGHTPFGHGGEASLKEIYSQDFSHNEQSLRVVDLIENNCKGLNLTDEVRDGILKHSKGFGDIISDDPEEVATTVEGRILRVADIMAYLNHDLDDAIRSKVIRPDQVPESCLKIIGRTHSERARTMMRDLIFSSKVVNGEFCLSISDELHAAMLTLRKFLYENVYRSDQVHKEFVKAKKILSELYTYFLNNEKMLKKKLEEMEMLACYNNEQPRERIVCDFIASMTDRYALNLYEEIFFPMPIV